MRAQKEEKKLSIQVGSREKHLIVHLLFLNNSSCSNFRRARPPSVRGLDCIGTYHRCPSRGPTATVHVASGDKVGWRVFIEDFLARTDGLRADKIAAAECMNAGKLQESVTLASDFCPQVSLQHMFTSPKLISVALLAPWIKCWQSFSWNLPLSRPLFHPRTKCWHSGFAKGKNHLGSYKAKLISFTTEPAANLSMADPKSPFLATPCLML